ncbi:hypothetical protein [Plantactinospora sp. KLBMP9567]|uniref:hypothetical protein n=1 Tax=Plantactinospora sp. KLBMP9567 TaxID=3085900 RepID=UPI0029828672|nr:hypothetical protein [Plantactinospora sp. KLBMP9567]MDW5329909.1 hypothetical protein [Plantactinospora sp. KLBMP9567]
MSLPSGGQVPGFQQDEAGLTGVERGVQVRDRIAGLGSVTSVVYSSTLPGRDLTAEATTPQSVAN